MGAVESTQPQDKYCGFRVYRLYENGPLQTAGVKELEDFLIPPVEVFSKRIPFIDYIKNNAGKKIELQVYNLVKRHYYTIEITPNEDWCENKGLGYLGASVRYENWSTAPRHLLRIIRVNQSSPGNNQLKLMPFEDYIIAIRPEMEDILTLNKDINDPSNLFSNYIHLYKDRPVMFYIYNSKTGARCVKTILNEKLGCDVAFGKLHEFPKEDSYKEGSDGSPSKSGKDKKEEEVNKNQKVIEYVEREAKIVDLVDDK